MDQLLRILKFLCSRRKLHNMIRKQVEGSVVIWIQHIENSVNPVLFLERQELRPINSDAPSRASMLTRTVSSFLEKQIM